MSLHVYEGMCYVPRIGFHGSPLQFMKFDREFIYDVEMPFFINGIKDIEKDIVRTVIKEIEKGEYFDELSFIDRFGVNVYLTEISTGSKALLSLAACKDKILNFNEVGINAIELAMCLFKEGYIYMDRFYGSLWYKEEIDLVMNDKYHYTEAGEFNSEW